MSKLNELIKDLSQPLPYEWRVQSFNRDKTKAICTSFIDARTVQVVLDEMCVKHGCTWDVDYKDVCGVIFCGITLTCPEGKWDSITRWDAGNRIEEDTQDKMYMQGGKSAASDAFKRAAVMFGIGRFLYDIAPMVLPAANGSVIDENGQKVYDLTTYIRGMNKKPQSKKKKPVSETPAATPPPEVKKLKKLKKLSQNSFDAMQKAIESGNYQAVEEVLEKYEMTLAQKTSINTLIAAAKAKAEQKDEGKSN